MKLVWVRFSVFLAVMSLIACLPNKDDEGEVYEIWYPKIEVDLIESTSY